MWKTVEAKTREVRVAEAERRRSKRRSRKKVGGMGRKEAKRKKDSRSKKGS